jgi:microcompartment protein CcmL/EutN
MEKQSLGLIETWGLVPAIEAADVGAKAANVILLGYQVVPVGRIVVTFVGDVAAVRAAVSAGAAAAQRLGQVLAVHVIPRLDAQIRVAPRSPPPPSEEKPEAEKPEPSVAVERPKTEAETDAPPAPEETEAEPLPGPPSLPKDKGTDKAPKPPSRQKKVGTRRKPGRTK